MSRGEKIVVVVGAFAALFLAAWYYYYPHAAAMPTPPVTQIERDITIGTTTIRADVVSTEAAREQGLSGRAGLAPNTGMLFVFDSDGEWGIWMKDMKFSIDIVWLAQDGVVVGLTEDATPQSYPKVFTPSVPARYVVELPAGFVHAHDIVVGTKFVL